MIFPMPRASISQLTIKLAMTKVISTTDASTETRTCPFRVRSHRFLVPIDACGVKHRQLHSSVIAFVFFLTLIKFYDQKQEFRFRSRISTGEIS